MPTVDASPMVAPVVTVAATTAPTPTKPKPPPVGSALAAVALLIVKGRSPMTG